MGLKLLVSNVDRTNYLQPGTLSIPDRLSQRSEATFTLRVRAGGWHPSTYDPVSIYLDDILIFQGFVYDPEEWRLVEVPGQAGLSISVRAVDMQVLSDRRIVAESYDNMTCGAIIRDLIGNYLSADGVKAGIIREGPTVTRVVFNYRTLSAVISELAALAGFYWTFRPSTAVNLFTPNQADAETNLVGFRPGTGATLSLTSSYYWQGSQSLAVAAPASTYGTFLDVDPLVGQPGDQVTFSFYLRNPSGKVRIAAYENGALTTITGPSGIPTSSDFVRQSITWNMTTTNPHLAVEIFNAEGSPHTFYCDAFKLEKGPLSDWSPGAGPTLNANHRTILLDFSDPTTKLSPWSVDESSKIRNLKVRRHREQYRNRQFIRGGMDKTNTRTEQFIGDGTRRAFTLAFPVGSKPSVTVGGGSKTVGIRGLDASGSYDFYWTKGDPVINQDDAATPLTSAQTLAVTYKGLFPILSQVDNPAEQATRALAEGSSGIYEAVEEAASIDSFATAQQIAQARLDRYGSENCEIQFQTMQPGLAAGQLLTVNLPSHGISGQFLLQEVTLSDHGLGVSNQWLYTVRGVDGQYINEWLNYWRSVLQPKGMGIRENEIVQQAKSASDGIVIGDTLTRNAAAPVRLVGTATVGFSEVG